MKNKIYIESTTESILESKELSNSEKNKILSLKEKALEAIFMYNNGIVKNQICTSLNLNIKTLNKILCLDENNIEEEFENTRDIKYKENINKKQNR